jgi:hypothetical protein
MGMYTVLGILFLFLIWREVDHGPVVEPGSFASLHPNPAMTAR